VFAESVDDIRIEGHAAVLMSLDVLLPDVTRDLADAALEHRHPGVEVELGPPQAADFPAARTGGHLERD